MAIHFERNRYLDLDATPLEDGTMRRIAPPQTLAITFAAAVAGCSLAQPDTNFSLIEPGMVTLCSLFMREMTNAAAHFLCWHLLDRAHAFHDYAIDTKPGQGTTNNGPPLYPLRVLFSAAMNMAIVPLTMAISVIPSSFLPGLAPIGIPNLITGLQKINACRNVLSGQWRIINRADMKPEPKSNPVVAPVFSASPG